MALANTGSAGLEPSRQELLDAEAHVFNHMFSFANSMCLKCAIELGIPDVIHKHGKPMTLPQLANALPINKSKFDGLYRLMRILTHSKFFNKVKNISKDGDEDEDEAYCLTLASHLLLRDGPMNVGPCALFISDPIMTGPWQHISEWFQNDDFSSHVTKHGRTVWEHVRADQRFNVLFNEAMAHDSVLVNSILVHECKQVFEGLRSMVDVGGGTGATAKGVADAFPGLKCIVLELPHVVAGLEGSENLSFVSGDMFDSIPHADAVFLKWILHAFNDENCVKVLKKCKEAVVPSKNNAGKVIVVEMVMNDQKDKHKATETQLFFDMQMVVQVAAKERTEKEWAKIFVDAGFESYKITPALGLRSVIEVFP